MDTNFGNETMHRIDQLRREAELHRIAAGRAGGRTRRTRRFRWANAAAQ